MTAAEKGVGDKDAFEYLKGMYNIDMVYNPGTKGQKEKFWQKLEGYCHEIERHLKVDGGVLAQKVEEFLSSRMSNRKPEAQTFQAASKAAVDEAPIIANLLELLSTKVNETDAARRKLEEELQELRKTVDFLAKVVKDLQEEIQVNKIVEQNMKALDLDSQSQAEAHQKLPADIKNTLDAQYSQLRPFIEDDLKALEQRLAEHVQSVCSEIVEIVRCVPRNHPVFGQLVS